MSSTSQATSTPFSKLLLPGFGLPLNHVPQEGNTYAADYIYKRFPSALSSANIEHGSVAQVMLTIRELTMLQIMNSITDKLDWHLKVHDENIVQKWRDEVIASGADVTTKMMDWCIAELRYKATLIPSVPAVPPPVIVYNGDVVKSDFAVSEELKTKLQEAVTTFEGKISARSKDWHPGSEEKVWDLVHPSLFPLVYGRTRVLANAEITTLEDYIDRCGQGEIAPIPPVEHTIEVYGNRNVHGRHVAVKNPYSAKFQWLPCEVDISGEKARITTCINNLHPQREKPLYGLISELITASIPLWELSLAPLRGMGFYRRQRIRYTEVLYDPDPEEGPEEDGPQQGPDEDEDDYLQRRDEWIEDTRKVVLPEPEGEFVPLPEPPAFSLKKNFGDRGLQVIVKLANIELTPEKPYYAGGTWHVEGQMNEHIVATSLYYYSCQNITFSALSFRQQCERDTLDISYRQNQFDWIEEVFGCEDQGPCVQEIGDVETREGRLLTFPNILQHRVGPFKLADPTKPGHRKIVALFLVDPNVKVVSTANVPCQRQDWWWEKMSSLSRQSVSLSQKSSSSSGIGGLPQELVDRIEEELEDAEFPISLQEAKNLRVELMEERKNFVTLHGKAFETTHTFSLCEH